MKKYCPNCGAPIQNTENKYCENCGEYLHDTYNSDTTYTENNSENESFRIERPNSTPSIYSSENEPDNDINETYGMTNSNTIQSPYNSENEADNDINETYSMTNSNTAQFPYNARMENDPTKITYHKYKFLAFILCIFPGVGQMYNGQILKGILIPTIMTILLLLITPFADNGFIILILLMLFLFTYFFGFADAFKTANDITKNNGNYFYSDNEQNNPNDEYNFSIFQIADMEISSYFHERGYDGGKTLSVLKIMLLIPVLYFVLLYAFVTFI